MDVEHTFGAVYVKGNGIGTFGVHPDDFAGLDEWLQDHSVESNWSKTSHPETGEPLKGYRPGEGDQLARVEKERGLRQGQWCRVTLRAVRKGDNTRLSLVDAEPEE